MIKKIWLCYGLLLFVLIMGGCKTTTIVDPGTANSASGKMLLKISKATVPDGIVTITAVLSRSGSDSLSESLNISTDTTSQIYFPAVATGTWNLRVDAKNANNLVVYSGTAAITVSAGTTTQAAITMDPISSTGSVQISLIWGSVSPWIDYPMNPLLSGSGYTFETGGVLQPAILYENGTYKMWFASLGNSGVCHVSYATSQDGLTWSRYPSPVLNPGDSAKWDCGTAAIGPVIKVNNTYRMYYNSWSSQYGIWSIGLATSSDGITWQKYSNPVLTGTSGNEYQVVATDIIAFNGKYYLYYTGRNYPYYNIYVAVSDDGIQWTRNTTPILTATQSWEGNGVMFATVIQDTVGLRMVFANDGEGSVSGFGFATSTDGKNWTKDAGNPFFTNSQSYQGWANKIAYPRLVKFDSKYRIYYTANNGGISSIGMLYK